MLYTVTGDVCKQVGQDVWTCKYQAYCSKAVEDLQAGKPLQTCNAQDLDNVVCCEPEEKLPYRELVNKNSESVACSVKSAVDKSPRLYGDLMEMRLV